MQTTCICLLDAAVMPKALVLLGVNGLAVVEIVVDPPVVIGVGLLGEDVPKLQVLMNER